MNQAIKEQWLDALRGGAYPQGSGSLQRTDDENNTGYCCLGVLCDLYAQQFGHDWLPGDAIDGWSYFTFLGHADFPPDDVVAWAGLPKSDPTVTFNNQTYGLGYLNDVKALPFSTIADLIEEQL